MTEYVDQIINRQQEPKEKRVPLDHKGSIDVAYALEGLARFRTNIFHSREALRDCHAANRDQDSPV